MMKGWFSAFVIFFGLLLIGCRPGLGYLEMHPSLSYAAVREGKLAVLPVTASDGSMDASTLTVVRVGLLRAVASARPGLSLVDIDAQLLAEGGGSIKSVTEAYSFVGMTPADASKQLAQALGARFLVFTNIDEDKVERSESSGTGDANTISKGRYTTRTVTVRMAIFDSALGLLVWSARHSGFRTERREAQTTHGSDATWLLDKATGYTEKFDHPEPPPLYQVTDEVLQRMVAYWPEP